MKEETFYDTNSTKGCVNFEHTQRRLRVNTTVTTAIIFTVGIDFHAVSSVKRLPS